ncbi:hypothetical protein HDV01_003961 [Terramyces sp. JEL0728]|nr:hypothetical protein HDV01_003961 [Terramyces sp. JEL0728]
MNKLAILASVALSTPCPYANLHKRGETVFQNTSASTQLAQVWSEIASSPAISSSYSYSNFELIFVESMQPTIDTVSDELPIEKGIFSSSRRQKRVHAAGAVAQVKFNAVQNPYTGLFQGADNAILRLSLAAQPSANSNSIVPGAAIKFFRDDNPSTNIFFMLGIDGQDDLNFFANGFSNHISPKEGGAIAGGILLRTFGKASNWPVFTGLSGVSAKEADGSNVSKPVYPFQLIFRPTDVAKQVVAEAIPKTDPSDAYRSLAALTSIPAGTELWTVWASPSPNTPFNQIGSVSTTSSVVLNAYGNTDLFFQHQTFEQDTAAGTIGKSWAKTCPNAQSCGTFHSFANTFFVFQ